LSEPPLTRKKKKTSFTILKASRPIELLKYSQESFNPVHYIMHEVIRYFQQ